MLDARGNPFFSPPDTFWASSSEGFLRNVICPRVEFDRKIGLERLLKAQAKNPRSRGSGPAEPAPTQEDIEDDPWRGAGPGAGGAKYPLKDCALTPAEEARW